MEVICMKNFHKITALCLALLLCLSLVPLGLAAEGSAPVAENLEICTYRGVSVGGKLSATDPEGDDLTFEITTEPSKGTIELESDGTFVYTPADGKKGRDYFGFRAIDTEGNASQEGTVIIKIQKQKTKVTYSDLDGNGSAYAAVALAESGLFVGESMGGEYVFSPDAEMTRGEFLTLCMALTDADILSGVRSTGFSDDDEIPAWVKPYVSTALMNGIISGYSGTDGATFDAQGSITCYEAAVMLNNCLGITDVVSASAFDAVSSVPAWASQAVVNLCACKVLDASTLPNLSETLTRADAAELLLGASEILANR